MKNLNEQLKELPEEFVIEMEQQKKDRWVDCYNFIVSHFNIQDEIDEVENEGFPLKDFFKKIHNIMQIMLSSFFNSPVIMECKQGVKK